MFTHVFDILMNQAIFNSNNSIWNDDFSSAWYYILKLFNVYYLANNLVKGSSE